MRIFSGRIVFIGAGHVGSHAAYALISQGLAEEIILIDTDTEKAEAQALDLSDSTAYLQSCASVRAGSYEDLKDACIAVICAGPLPDIAGGQTDRMQTLEATVTIMKDIVKGIRTSGFDGIIINISNPADVVTHYLQHELSWPERRILSTSTTLDSARLRRAISEAAGIDRKSVSAYALSEHGESQFAAWSQVTVGGKPLYELMEEYPGTYGKLDLERIEEDARHTGWVILGGKGSTEFGIGASLAEVVRAILKNEHRILPVSVYLRGEYGYEDVFCSVPCVLGSEGIERVIELNLDDREKALLRSSIEKMNACYRLALTL